MKRVLPAAFMLALSAQAEPQRLTLDEARRLALELSPELHADYQDIGVAQSQLAIARADYLPSVKADFTAAGGKAYGGREGASAASLDPRIAAGAINAPSVLDRAAAGISLGQLVTDFGRTDRLIESARASLSAEQDRYEDLRQRLLLRVTVDYYRALEAQSTLRVAQKSYDERKLLFEQINLLQKNKLKSELDVGFAGVNLEQARLLILQTQDGVASAFAELSTAIGLPAQQELQLQVQEATPEPPPEALETLLQQADAQRPELKSLRSAADAARLYAKAQRGLANPSLSLLGVAGTAPFGDARVPENYLAGGVNLSVPIFEGGRLQARYREAAFKAQRASDVLSAAQLAVSRDVRMAWLSARAIFQSIAVAQRLRATAGQALDLAASRYRLGLSSIVELNRAQLNDIDAQIAYVRARYDYQIAAAQLAYEVGGAPSAAPNTRSPT